MARYITIDSIVESYLAGRELTVHWYVLVLKHATDCYRELYFDTLGRNGLSQMRLMEVRDCNIIKMPCDFVDVVGVWNKGYSPGKCGTNIRVVKIDRKNELIYLDPHIFISGKQVLMEYLTDGSDCNATAKVNPFAQKTIETYITWKRSPNRDNPRSPEAIAYYAAHDNLRGRLSDLTLEDIEYIRNNRGRIQVNNYDWINDL